MWKDQSCLVVVLMFLPHDFLQCKKMVFEYAPVILINAEHFLEKNDVCTIMHACQPAVDKEDALPEMQTSLHSAS